MCRHRCAWSLPNEARERSQPQVDFRQRVNVTRHGVAWVRRDVKGMRGMLAFPVAPIGPMRTGYPADQGLSKEDRVQRKTIVKDRLFVLPRLRLCHGFTQSNGVTRRFQASKKRKRHASADVHSDLIEQARVKIDGSPAI